MNLWNIPERPLEPPEDVVVGECDHCGGEIYEGEEVYDIDGYTVHEDCLLDFVKDRMAVRREAEIYAKAYC